MSPNIATQLNDATDALRAQITTIIQMHQAGQNTEQIAQSLLEEAKRNAVREAARALGVELKDFGTVGVSPVSPITCATGFIQCDGMRPELVADTDRLELDLGNDVRRTALAGHVTAWNAVKGWRLAN